MCGGFEFFPRGTTKIDRADAWRGILDSGGKHEADGEQRGARLGFGSGLRGADDEGRAAGDCLGRRHTELDSERPSGGIGGEHDGFFAGTRKKSGGAIGHVIGCRTQDRVQGEVGDVEDGEHEVFGVWCLVLNSAFGSALG
jgi:hypothetical protein